MTTITLPSDLRKFISDHGYELRDSDFRKVIQSKSSFSFFKTAIFIVIGLFLFVGGFMFELLYVLGVLVMLIPVVKYYLRKRYVYEFDLSKGIFEIKDSLNPGSKKAYSFRDIKGIDVNHYVSDGDASAFSDSNKEYNYEVVLKVGNRQEYELFYFTETEFNPNLQVSAIKSNIAAWLKPAAI